VRASNRWLSIGVVTALADTELPTITERTEMQIKTISAVVGRSQSTINSAPLHISNICSANYAEDEGIQFHTFGWVFILTQISSPRFLFMIDRSFWIHYIAAVDRIQPIAKIIFLENYSRREIDGS
jgi:hypothetical protein